MNKKIIIIIGIAAAILVTVGVWYFSMQQKLEPKYTGPVEKATVGVETSLLPAAVWIAENKGYFQEYGLDLTIKEFESGRASFTDMLNGGVDFATVAPTPIMFNSFDRQDFSIFATFVYSDEDVKILARKDRGISTATDLKGKRVGTPAGTTGQFFLAAFLTVRGLSESDVEIIDIRPTGLPGALQNGQVDAIVIWEPHAYNAEQLLRGNAIRLPSSDVYRETFNFMVMKDFASDNPEILKRFVKSIDKATAFISDNEEEAQDIVAVRIGLDKEAMITLWKDFVFDISLDQSLLFTLEDEARWAIQSNLTEKTEVPNYLHYIYFDALEAVKPEAVSIIR
jgi:ABC-type nitrate/sulfonate/bicarbonate transport system substrate-binding protein